MGPLLLRYTGDKRLVFFLFYEEMFYKYGEEAAVWWWQEQEWRNSVAQRENWKRRVVLSDETR